MFVIYAWHVALNEINYSGCGGSGGQGVPLLGAGLSAAPALLSAQVSPGDCQGQQGAGGGEEREGDIRREGKGREERQQREREI